MSRRLLETNQRCFEAALSAPERVRLLQDRAVLLARLGRVAEAEQTLLEAEQQMPCDGPVALKLRFAYVRAIETYFSKRFAEARCAMYEAFDEARGFNEQALVAECDAALALFMQREGNVRATIAHAKAALANSHAPREARFRASLALASLHQDAYDHESAYRLYREMDDTVKELDDEIATAGWLQRAALAKAAAARQSAACGEPNLRSVNEAIAALRQCIDYSTRVSSGPSATLGYLLLAAMHVLQRQYAAALEIYDSHLPQSEGEGFLQEVTAAMADRATCLLKLGSVDAGYAQAVASLRRLDDASPAEIRALVHENMATAMESVQQSAQARQHRVMAQAAWDTRRHEQREARRILNEAATPLVH